MLDVKELVRQVPVLGPLLVEMRRKLTRPRPFENSGSYWEERYASGGNSGAGSYNRLAQFKAEILNNFVNDNDIEFVAEIGCGDGAQLTLAKYPSYIGYDISPTSIALCQNRFVGDPTKSFRLSSEDEKVDIADAVLSLDVIYHLVEDDVFFSYMNELFDSARQYVVIYSSDYDELETSHVRHRRFTAWVEKNRHDFSLIRHIPNRYPYHHLSPSSTSLADFYIYRRVE